MIGDLKTWLRKKPTLHSLRVTTAAGEIKAVRLDGQAPRRFTDAEQLLYALKAVFVEGLDKGGAVVRVAELHPNSPADAEAKAVAGLQADLTKNLRPDSARQSDLQHFSVLLRQAFTDGANAASKPMDMAFSVLGQILELILKRVTALELQQARSIRMAQRDIEANPPGGEDQSPEEQLFGEMARAWIAGKMASGMGGGPVAEAAAAAATSANGAAKPPKGKKGKDPPPEEDD